MGVRRFSGRVTTAAASRRVADSSSLLGAAAAFKLSLVVPAAAAPGEQTTVAAEEAVCRICMVALSEVTAGAGREDEPDGGVLKLECCCKGELALAHTACAVKWFGIKGNGTCDVCSQEVLNLPVILRHHPQSAPASAPPSHHEQQEQQGRRHHSRRVWRGTPILVVISMLAYFCFLEQLLVGDHGVTAALAISLPFACVLGLFSSLTTINMVSRRYVWIYSAVQFLFIVLFTHLFYRYVRMQAVISIIVSTFAGFSVSICAHSALLLILRWRNTRRAAASAATTGDEEQGRGASTEQPPAIGIEVALPPPP